MKRMDLNGPKEHSFYRTLFNNPDATEKPRYSGDTTIPAIPVFRVGIPGTSMISIVKEKIILSPGLPQKPPVAY
jgi:hypothetical protein